MKRRNIINFFVRLLVYVSYFSLVVPGFWILIQLINVPIYTLQHAYIYIFLFLPVLIILFLHPKKNAIKENIIISEEIENSQHFYFHAKSFLKVVLFLVALAILGIILVAIGFSSGRG